MENLIQESEKELKDLKRELIECCNAIKTCTDGERRQAFFQEKKEIQADIEEVESDLKRLIDAENNPINDVSQDNSEIKSELETLHEVSDEAVENSDSEKIDKVHDDSQD